MEEVSGVRKELNEFIQRQCELGMRRKDIALILFNKGKYSEVQVGKVMNVHPKTAHAFKIDFSKAGKEEREKTGKRVHLDGANLSLKRVEGKKMLTKFLSLVDAVLESDNPTVHGEEKTNE